MGPLSIILLIIPVICSAQIILQPNVINYNTITPFSVSQTYELTTRNSFEVNVWRTSRYSGNSFQQPTVSFTVSGPSVNSLSSGKITVSPVGQLQTFKIVMKNPLSEYTYSIRYCPSYCLPSCPTYLNSYCNNAGSCNNVTNTCLCDYLNNNSTLLTSDCTGGFGDEWTKYFAIWVTLIVVGVFLVFLIPCIICICCCGACAAGIGAAASSGGSRTEVRNVYVNDPQYSQPTQYQPVAQYQQQVAPVQYQQQGAPVQYQQQGGVVYAQPPQGPFQRV